VIDASIAIYQWCHIGATKKIVNARGQYINHIQGALFRTARILAAGLRPVFVFDGRAPRAKAATIARRAPRRLNIRREVYTEVAKLLDLLGVEVVYAPGEAEAQGAAMVASGAAAAITTEDSDALVFGAPLLVRGLTSAAKTVTVINEAKVRRGLGLTRLQFIDLCILLGSDYAAAPAIGAKTALRLIREYGSLPKLVRAYPEYDFDYGPAREAFRRPAVARVKVGPARAPDITALRHFLIDVHGLSPARVEGTLAKLSRESSFKLVISGRS
jgi:flap endonuclease-1